MTNISTMKSIWWWFQVFILYGTFCWRFKVLQVFSCFFVFLILGLLNHSLALRTVWGKAKIQKSPISVPSLPLGL